MEKDNGKSIGEIGLLKQRIGELEKIQFDFKQAEDIAREGKELAENIIDAIRDPLVIMDAGLKIELVNTAFYKTFEVRPNETIGQFIYDLGNGQWNIPKLRKLLENILPSNAYFDDYVIEHDFPSLGKRIMVLNARRIPRPPAKPRIILLAITDITDVDKLRMSFERMAELGLFTKIAHSNESTIVELKKEVNALLAKLGEKLRYNNGAV
jgi:two-component system cell cycle sensor histidine kinase/response regulator CckA